MSDRDIPNDQIADFDASPLSARMIADLRSDHAGEVGAVMIYRGILAVSRDAGVRTFAQQHLESEQRHQAFFEGFLPARHQSRLLPVWRLAGWLTGALPALFGAGAVYLTIEAVETFVDRHYAEQIEAMSNVEGLETLSATLEGFRRDEVAHRDEAAALSMRHGLLPRAWQQVVAVGSSAGVALARRV